ncbi:ComF family protein [Candidatus Saccharibacteria bacterium]|nr:ComF family protein [Candidatus Saccharibacteria bacterium]
MLNAIQKLFLPDICCSCGEIGSILCPSCTNDITDEHVEVCISCALPVASVGKCMRCRLPYSRAWYVGYHQGSLKALVAVSKFTANRSGCTAQAALLDACLPQLPERTVLVPVPTIARHIRQRGYGHAERIATSLAQLRNVSSQRIVVRREQHVQHGASKKVRQQQAMRSFVIDGLIQNDTTYVVVDDVFTTGSTVAAVSDVLRAAGAQEVWVAVTSRQPHAVTQSKTNTYRLV